VRIDAAAAGVAAYDPVQKIFLLLIERGALTIVDAQVILRDSIETQQEIMDTEWAPVNEAAAVIADALFPKPWCGNMEPVQRARKASMLGGDVTAFGRSDGEKGAGRDRLLPVSHDLVDVRPLIRLLGVCLDSAKFPKTGWIGEWEAIRKVMVVSREQSNAAASPMCQNPKACLISWIQPGPAGGALASLGRQGSNRRTEDFSALTRRCSSRVTDIFPSSQT
jgi:hypothetical protein